jgi:hypothetical protein
MPPRSGDLQLPIQQPMQQLQIMTVPQVGTPSFPQQQLGNSMIQV